ncbi:hypothetical protein TWF225_004361 [Orbilia oligospora]|uniref:Uncharacterized protein n=1 Tax=Orbilia oligospora TaxID=2813651 RepID=A0A7C8JCM2_ORBOL|nr:hypothetical protein TWF102_006946 [Orbilia oligospora]KAF3114262.1 hypothetical protein TWF706_008199 [Orbilia oligospora]KAF3187206.1 hypothetical protein TWF225_004361 [Orbilia oligospora]KAF3260004.1 hypothetical protein TWF217_005030 [Orbilia oligospora]KAF3267087.1 hypothetical protein TWF128_010043 [Orbilia oligospora]
MVGFSKSTLAIVAVLNLLTGTFAAPALAPEPIDYVSLLETAPGLPTPKDLGLTNADLARPPPDIAAHQVREILNKRYNPVCWPGQPQCDLTDANACWVYLNSLGGTRCVVSPGTSYILPMLRAVAGGFLATAGQGPVGSNAAYGNGNHLVDVVGRGRYD